MQTVDDIAIVGGVAKTADAWGRVVELLNQPILVIAVFEFPFFELVHSDSAEFDGAMFTDDGDRAFPVTRSGEHGHVRRADGPAAEFEGHRAGILGSTNKYS